MLQSGSIPWNSAKAEQVFENALIALMDFVIGGGVDDAAPAFSYLLTPKQIDTINRICQELGWPQVTVPGVLVDAKFARHVLKSRSSKDCLPPQDIKALFAKGISQRSSIARNAKESLGHEQQTLMFNTHQKVLIGGTRYSAMVVLGIKSEGLPPRNYLAPITCYHASEAKVRALKSR